MSFLIDVKALAGLFQKATKPLVLLDATWYMPNDPKNGHDEFLKNRLPGAQFFDIDGVKDFNNPLPHMLPTASLFAEYIGKLGIDRNSSVVVYDRIGLFSSPRVYWTFKVFGHEDVSILSGGLPAWTEAGFELETGEPNAAVPKEYKGAVLNKNLVASFEDIIEISQGPNAQNAIVVDARAPERFNGSVPEVRPGIACGCIPKSINVFFKDVLDNSGLHLKPVDVLKQLFVSKGLADPKQPIVTSCGSGITASTLFVALHAAGYSNVRVYDESWTGYGKRAAEDPKLLGH
ncbi:thiosulfate sulfurtransferase [Schizosaccharomyces japonicus yFS275]|uniref:Thiosulfate sulfurtransferase n=1 Tax=Schizosaccharomyces japonicus (strain yFS275 / FY16936) TaxID=402676 RepID=B6K5Y7_SCHJY|nr:thiosulfate sulfurtransferase [Schizosaccharomyces japonicus yFS275]EEB08941.1 thiosulfate sulfurtransferase [Schizosaccharomyces japonicus yFS275]